MFVNMQQRCDVQQTHKTAVLQCRKEKRMSEWIPCKMVNQCYIPSLKDMGYGQVLITYLSGKGKKPQVTSAWIERGRTINKKYNDVIAWMPLPEPWEGEQDEP